VTLPDIAGFRALTYDPTRVDLSQVVTPPYDVIDARERAKLASRHSHNFVRIDLPEPAEAGADRYRTAAETLEYWLADGTLRRDTTPAVYRYHQVFTDQEQGHSVTRKGLVAAVQLSPWSDGVIRPHETTFAGPREDRARLLDATRVHLSPIFAMYEDPVGEVEQMLATGNLAPDLAAMTDDGTLHNVWRVAAPDIIAKLSQFLRDKCAYVLDGHHRYETMVAFRDRELGRGAHAGQRGLLFLVPMSDPGLIILPTHRIVVGVNDLTRDRFLADMQRHGTVQVIAGGARDAGTLRQALQRASGVPTFAAVFPGDPDAHILSLTEHGQTSPLESEISVLHDVILERVLAIPAEARKAHIRYVSNTQGALDQIAGGDGQLALIVRPPTLAQVKQISDAGRVMPQKSTYFFPKLASGLIMMPVE
jgi:uncharacterized protein (DUF1015 family)